MNAACAFLPGSRPGRQVRVAEMQIRIGMLGERSLDLVAIVLARNDPRLVLFADRLTHVPAYTRLRARARLTRVRCHQCFPAIRRRTAAPQRITDGVRHVLVETGLAAQLSE